MKKVKRITAVLIMLALCITIAACNGSTTPDSSSGDTTNTGGTPATGGPTATEGVLNPGVVIPPPEGDDVQFADTIDIILQANVTVLDLFQPGAIAAVRVIYGCIYDKLVVRTPDGEYVPELATSWETDDMQTWTFYLRNDVTFHNGDKFTAQDIIDTVMLSKEAPGSLSFDAWRNVESVTAIDEYTVQINLDATNADFLYLISVPGGGIISKAARELDPITGAWVGTGAFYIDEFVSGEHITLIRNDNYWGEMPLTRQLYYHYVPEIAARAIMLHNGENHVCLGIGPEDLDSFVGNPGFTIYPVISNSVHNLAFSLVNPITGDLNFRLAVSHALERSELCTVGVGAWGIPVTDGAIWGDTTEFRNTDIPLLPYDLDLAREYLAKSSYNGEELEIICAEGALHLSAQMIQTQLGMIGIKTRVSLLDPVTLAGVTVYGSDQVDMVHYVSPFDLSAASARRMFYPGGSSNRASYNNPTVNELLDLAPTIADPAEREAIYRQIQEIVVEEIPYINLYYRIQTVVTSSAVGGILTNADMNYDFRGIFMTLGY